MGFGLFSPKMAAAAQPAAPPAAAPTALMLHVACTRTGQSGLPKVIECLDSGLSVHVVYAGDGNMPIHTAADAGMQDIVELLLDRGANIEGKDASGNSPLFRAVQSSKWALARFLISRAANVGTRNKKGQSLLYSFAMSNGTDALFLDILLDPAGAALSIHDRDSDDHTPLMVSAGYYNSARRALSLFVKKGARIDAVIRSSGRSALHIECSNISQYLTASADKAGALLSLGASHTLKDKDGNTPFDLITGTPKQRQTLLANLKASAFDRMAADAIVLRQDKKVYKRAYSVNKKLCLTDNKFCDVVFVCGNERVPAHKCILSAGSQVFEAMLDSMVSFREGEASEIPIPQSVTALKAALQFLYTGVVNKKVCQTEPKELLDLASMWALRDLTVECEIYAVDFITVQNVVPMLINAHLHGLDHLKECCFKLIKERLAEVTVHSTDYLELHAKQPALWEELKAELMSGQPVFKRVRK